MDPWGALLPADEPESVTVTRSQSFRAQARNLEILARRTPMGFERIQLSQEAKSLHLAADQAECAERDHPAPADAAADRA